MSFRLTPLHENARSALDCGCEAAAREPVGKAVAGEIAIQGAFVTVIFMAAKDLCGSLRENSAKDPHTYGIKQIKRGFSAFGSAG